jgi:hypothetical protein
MNLKDKPGTVFLCISNVLAAYGACSIWIVYGTFAMWGASGLFYWVQLLLLSLGAVGLLIGTAASWSKRPIFDVTSITCSAVVLILALLVLIPTLRTRHGRADFSQILLWVIIPIVFLVLNILLSYSNLRKLKALEVTPWQP